MMFEPNAKLASKIEAIADALLALSPGETITYVRLSRLAHEQIEGASYVMQRAIKRAEQQSGAIFDNVHGKGYQRLETKDIPGVGKKANARIRRTARKARKRFEGVRANDMTPKEVAALAAYRSHFGMVEGIAQQRTVEAVAESLEASRPVPAAKIADKLAALMERK